MNEITIQIPQSRIIATVGPKPVDGNGRISVGREHIGKNVIAYVVEECKSEAPHATSPKESLEWGETIQ